MGGKKHDETRGRKVKKRRQQATIGRVELLRPAIHPTETHKNTFVEVFNGLIAVTAHNGRPLAKGHNNNNNNNNRTSVNLAVKTTFRRDEFTILV